jgi:crotonobetainyl-CoA:carnitine CoA-transferase CaiB-like acyl-CoA transferase
VVIDLKSDKGQEVMRALIAGADVVHWNLRTGVADRLGFGYEQVRAINPNIVWGHVTAYGGTGPLAKFPGVDQMGQAICGHEWEQGATDNGGHPTWYRFGMCDASAAMCSVMGVLEALLTCGDRSRRVDADIITGALLMASNAFLGPDSLERRAHLDGNQMGLSPLYRLYETSDGWLCIAVLTDAQWTALCDAIGQPELTLDPHFADRATRRANATRLAAELEIVFASRSAEEWFAALDANDVPCEISALDFGDRFYDDPDVVANGWVAGFEHPTWGLLEQAGKLLDLSVTPVKVQGPPPVRGAHTREVLLELGYSASDLDEMAAQGVII